MPSPIATVLAEAGDPRWRLGLRAERLAEDYLAARGYEVRARRFRTRGGEIDLVLRDGETLVFVEVKARSTEGYGSPAERVDGRKRNRLARAAAAYLAMSGEGGRICRFDVVEVRPGTEGDAIRHLPDAFRLGSGARPRRGG